MNLQHLRYLVPSATVAMIRASMVEVGNCRAVFRSKSTLCGRCQRRQSRSVRNTPACLTRRIRRSERPGLSRRSPAEPRRSRLFCTHAPGLGFHRRRLRTGLSHGLTAARLEPSVKTGCCRGPFRLALLKEPAGVCPVSRTGHPCGTLHRAGLTGRPLTGVASDLRCSRMRFGKRDAPAARGTAARP
jgi:hypothetical protein